MARISKEQKKERRNKAMIGFITIFVMIGGGLGIFANQIGTNDDVLDYNQYEFERTDYGWMTKTGGQKSYFSFHPLELEELSVDGDFKSVLQGANTLELTSDPNSALAVEFARVKDYFSAQIYTFFTIATVNGFSVNTSYEVPVITCESATESNPVIIFEQGESLIKVDGYCITVYGQNDVELGRNVDRMLYTDLGIME